MPELEAEALRYKAEADKVPELEALLSSLRADLAAHQSSPDLSEDLERLRLQHVEEMALGAQRLKEATERQEESEKKLADLQVSLFPSTNVN